jgi:hypothetical protein
MSSINPVGRSSINPRVTSSINPSVTSNIAGLFIFDLQLNPVGFTVTANDRVSVLYSPSNDFSGVLVFVRQDFRVEFDLSNNWVG